MRQLTTTILEATGSVLVVAGVWRFSPALGMVICGLLLIGIGVRNA